jgi:hypothetical protein
MSALEKLQEEIADTAALIAEAERALLARPTWADSLALNLGSLRKLQTELETEFAETANRIGLDVCRYRLFADNPNTEELKISSLTSALHEFQTLFTLVFEALKRNEPKRTGHISLEAMTATAFGFGHSFAGSVGFAMTLPNEAMLLGPSDHDQAMGTLFSLAKAKDTSEMSRFAKQLGSAPIRAAYRWATHHVIAGFGADIHWGHSNKDLESLFIQSPELQHLREIIEQTGDTEEEDIEVLGLLVQADVRRLTFRIEPDIGDPIHGTVRDGVFGSDGPALNHAYKTIIRRTTILRLSMDTDDTRYKLLSLERL